MSERFGILGLAAVLLALLALGTPWTVQVLPLGFDMRFGYAEPAAWVALVAVLGALLSPRRWAAIACLAAGLLALAGMLVWIGLVMRSAAFTAAQFDFVIPDLVADGWFLALAALVAVYQQVAGRESRKPASLPVALAWGVVPGAGLHRLGHRSAAFVWTLAAVVLVFLVRAAAIDSNALSTLNAHESTPPPVDRLPEALSVAGLLVVWLGSLAHTWRDWLEN